MDDYKIELGVKLDTSDVKEQISKIDDKYKVKLGLKLNTNDVREQISKFNTNTNNIKVKLGVKLDEKGLRQEIKKLGNIKTDKNLLSFNTESLEASLRDVATTIKDIRTSLGTLDNGAGMKSLLSSINQISTALDKASGKFDELNLELKTLSSKDFSINVGLDMGKKSTNMIGYGRAARKQVIPQLEEQIKYLEDLYGGQQAAMSKLARNKNIGFDIFTDFADFNSDSAIKKMEAMEKYVNALKRLAVIDNVDLSGFDSKFSKSATEMINDITGIDNAVDKAEDSMQKIKNLFGSNIDADGLNKQLDSIVADLGEIKTTLQGLSSGVSLEGLTQSFDRLSETLEQLMTNAKLVQDVLGSGATNTNVLNQDNEAQETAKAYREVANEAKKLDNISIDISDGNIDDIKNALRSMKVDDSDIEEATRELNEMNVAAKNVSATFKNGQLVKVDVKGIETMTDGFERAITAVTTFSEKGVESSIKYGQAFDKIAIAAEKIHTKLKDTGFNGFEQEIQRQRTAVESLSGSYDDLNVALKQLDVAMEAVNSADQANDTKKLVAANEEYENSLKRVISLLKMYQDAESLDTRKEKALLRLESLYKEGSEAAQKYGAEVEELKRKIESCGNVKGILSLNKQIDILGQKIRNTGVQTQTFGQQLKAQFSKYSAYFGVAEVFMYTEQALRSMFEQVKLIDSAMTELKKVTNETDASYNQFLTNAASRAKALGTTIDGLVASTADFARLGYGFEESQGLAEVANIYAVVGDDINNVEEATQSLISTLTAFKDEANSLSDSDFAMSIVDKMNEVSNNFAISSGGIGEALQRSASSMQAANNSLDETIALITAANTVVQDPESVGKRLCRH